VAFGLNITAHTARGRIGIRFRGTQQLFVPAVDIDFGKRWEFNFGVGVGRRIRPPTYQVYSRLPFFGAIAFAR
jgi:hypothetical protein